MRSRTHFSADDYRPDRTISSAGPITSTQEPRNAALRERALPANRLFAQFHSRHRRPDTTETLLARHQKPEIFHRILWLLPGLFPVHVCECEFFTRSKPNPAPSHTTRLNVQLEALGLAENTCSDGTTGAPTNITKPMKNVCCGAPNFEFFEDHNHNMNTPKKSQNEVTNAASNMAACTKSKLNERSNDSSTIAVCFVFVQFYISSSSSDWIVPWCCQYILASREILMVSCKNIW